jgi:D-3-phosphoglycerate dehydrogenase / 2-oxoglutarate reductase
MYTVLFVAPYMIPYTERFRPIFEHYGIDLLILDDITERMEEADILKYAGQFDGVICGDDRYSPKVLEACAPRLKVISKWGTGVDSIHAETCARLGIMLGRTPNAFTNPVADSVLGYMLAFVRRQPWMDTAMKNHVWEKIPGKTLGECTLGVVGVGQIGSAVLRRASAFGMTLLGTDIAEANPHFVRDYRVELTDLDDLLTRADFVSLNTDLNPSSHHLINERTLGLMQSNSVLINTSRGPVVNETALIAALESGKIAGAALDVFEHEPLKKSNPLLQMDNVMLAPHNANSSPAAWERVHWSTLRNLLAGLGIDHSDLSQFM